MQTVVNPLVKAANGCDESAGVILKTDSYLALFLYNNKMALISRDDWNWNQVTAGVRVLS